MVPTPQAAFSSPIGIAPRVGCRAPGRSPRAPGGRVTWVLRHYPISILVLAPYALLLLPMAVLYTNPQTMFILRLLGAALVGTLIVETTALTARPQRHWRPSAAAVNASHRYV